MKNANFTSINVLGFSGWVGFFLESKQRPEIARPGAAEP